jgi:thiamine-monophosphate kinase
MGKELELVEWLRARAHPGTGVLLGIGDDGAVIDPGGRGPLVFACDQVVEQVHFVPDRDPWPRVGRKVLARNLSDLAAMGARPWVALCAVAWPEDRPTSLLEALLEGLLQHAREEETALVGGDLSRSPGGVRVDVSVLGLLEGRRALLRSGARPGDALYVTGPLGGSAGGHHLSFTPRWREGIALAESGRVHAAIDLSDGLAIDLRRLLAASGAGARVELEQIPRRELADGRLATLEQALGDGEDFELLFAAPEDAAASLGRHPALSSVRLTRIGSVTESGLAAVDARGRVTELPRGGYEHRFHD